MTDAPHSLLEGIDLKGLQRVDVGLEGDWSGSVVTVWDAATRETDFSRVARSHPRHRPSAELYFDGAWIGIHCFRVVDGLNVFDEAFASELVAFVER